MFLKRLIIDARLEFDCPQVSSADTLCKQFGPRSGSKLFDTQMVVLKEFFENVDFEKKNQQTKKR